MIRKQLVLLDAPSNLGLRPPAEGVVPGCYKLPWALRDRGLREALEADEGGSLVPPRYVSTWRPGDGDRNAEGIAAFSLRLADRLHILLEAGKRPLVLGGDCSVLLGNLLALKRRGRYGLVFLDAHSDFRHPHNAPTIGAAAGEDLAIVTGRGDARLINLESLGPYIQPEDVHLIGVRPFDEHLEELVRLGVQTTTSLEVETRGVAVLPEVLQTVTGRTEGFWLHCDLDVLDETEMPAVDSPESQGLSFEMLTDVLRGLLASPLCVGMDLTIFEPDLDPEGVHAQRIVTCLANAFSQT